MAPRIYLSSAPTVPVVATSVFSHLFAIGQADNPQTTSIGGFPASTSAFVDAETGASITRGQTRELALRFAHGLKHHREIQARRGDVIFVFSHNSLCWPVALFGSVAAGLRSTLANSGYTAKELAYQYTDSGAGLVLTSEDGLPVVFEMFTSLGVDSAEARRRIVVLETGLEWAGGPPIPRSIHVEGLKTLAQLLDMGKLEEEEKFEGQDAHETVYMCYSSGTTGKPKGVETTHQNITTVLAIVKDTFPKLTIGQDSIMGVLPYYHVYGAVKLLHFPWTCGVPMVIQPRFDPEKFCASIEKYRVTVAFIVPPILVVLSRHPAVDKYDLSSLKLLFSGAAPLGPALAKQIAERIESVQKAKGNFFLLQGYGLTETSPTTHLMPLEDSVRKVGSIGILLANLEARLVNDVEGRGETDAEEGEAGELWIRGPTVMKGYLRNPKATKDSITSDGWFKTGDVAIRDSEGFYYIVDRRKELIKYKGFQVPPAELEGLLLTHPDIADTAVIGVNSAREATELPRAYVVHANPANVNTDAAKRAFAKGVQKWIQERVARHKYLRGGVTIIDVIPKSAAGKILRRELRELAKAELAGRDPAGEEKLQPKL